MSLSVKVETDDSRFISKCRPVNQNHSSASLVNSEITCITHICVALVCNITVNVLYTVGLSLLLCSPFVFLHMQEDFKNRLKTLKVKQTYCL